MTRRGAVTASSGNVFADLDLPDAVEEKTKMDLAIAINDAISERKLRQAAAAQILQATQPQISALARYKLSGFSVGRLIEFLAALDRDVEIVHRRSEHGGHGHIRVRELASPSP